MNTIIDWSAPPARVWKGWTVEAEHVSRDGRTRWTLQISPQFGGVVIQSGRCDNRAFRSQYGKPTHCVDCSGPVDYCRRQFKCIQED
jgi:hypothetical protein